MVGLFVGADLSSEEFFICLALRCDPCYQLLQLSHFFLKHLRVKALR